MDSIYEETTPPTSSVEGWGDSETNPDVGDDSVNDDPVTLYQHHSRRQLSSEEEDNPIFRPDTTKLPDESEEEEDKDGDDGDGENDNDVEEEVNGDEVSVEVVDRPKEELNEELDEDGEVSERESGGNEPVHLTTEVSESDITSNKNN